MEDSADENFITQRKIVQEYFNLRNTLYSDIWSEEEIVEELIKATQEVEKTMEKWKRKMRILITMSK